MPRAPPLWGSRHSPSGTRGVLAWLAAGRDGAQGIPEGRPTGQPSPVRGPALLSAVTSCAGPSRPSQGWTAASPSAPVTRRQLSSRLNLNLNLNLNSARGSSLGARRKAAGSSQQTASPGVAAPGLHVQGRAAHFAEAVSPAGGQRLTQGPSVAGKLGAAGDCQPSELGHLPTPRETPEGRVTGVGLRRTSAGDPRSLLPPGARAALRSPRCGQAPAGPGEAHCPVARAGGGPEGAWERAAPQTGPRGAHGPADTGGRPEGTVAGAVTTWGGFTARVGGTTSRQHPPGAASEDIPWGPSLGGLRAGSLGGERPPGRGVLGVGGFGGPPGRAGPGVGAPGSGSGDTVRGPR